MTNIERFPEAFENGIPKVGGRWTYHGKAYEVLLQDPDSGHLTRMANGTMFSRLATDRPDYYTFLGFADSVNQGAAAPRKPAPEMRRDGSAWLQSCACGALTSSGATRSGPWSGGPTEYNAKLHHPIGCEPIAASAPLVAPPPSLKAAVQQEGLSIPPQTTTRHEVFEAAAQKWEGHKQFELARQNMKQARAALAADRAYDAEADAIRENRVIKKIALREMGAGDLACFSLRNLREFTAIKSAEHALYFWWQR